MTRHNLRVTDVSLTDGQSAVWAGAMTTPMAGRVVGRFAAARVDSIEVLSPATMRRCVARGEDPWQRIDLVRERCPAATLRAVVGVMSDHGRRGADVIATDVAVQWLRELKRRGVGEALIVDPLVDMARVGPLFKETAALDIAPIAALPFHEDAALTDRSLAEQATTLAAAGAARILLRDESGVMTPDRLATLLPALRQALGTTPLDLHLGCQTALGPMVALEAVRLGVDGLDTAFGALANGASVPSLGTLVKSMRLLGLDVSADHVQLAPVNEADGLLDALVERHGFAPALPWAFSLAPFIHQLPGAVSAEFMQRLANLGRPSQLNAFAHECSRVRRDLGLPPMTAPFAQPIAEQAWLHLQGLPRYAELRPGVRRIIQQGCGGTASAIDAGLAMRVGRYTAMPAQSLHDLRARFPEATDAALVLAQVCGISPMALQVPAPFESLVDGDATPAEALIEGLSARAARYAQLDVSGPGFAVRLTGPKAAQHA